MKLLPSAPEVPGVAAARRYPGGWSTSRWSVSFLRPRGYNTEGRFGDIRQRPDEHDLADVEGRVRGILRRLHRVLPLGKLDLA